MKREEVTVSTARVLDGVDLPSVEVTGQLVVPGLAITPYLGRKGHLQADFFNITHILSGLTLGIDRRCRVHIEAAATAVEVFSVELGIDWTVDKETLTAPGELRTSAIAAIKAGQAAGGGAFECRWLPCGDVPSWSVRCDTCDWEWDEDDDYGGPIDAKEAKEIAADHRCDPVTRLLPPGADPIRGWVYRYDVSDDGTVRRG